MPRGVRKSLEEQIAEIDRQIEELTELKAKLQKQKDQEDIRKLLEAAKEVGLSPEELVKKLTGENSEG